MGKVESGQERRWPGLQTLKSHGGNVYRNAGYTAFHGMVNGGYGSDIDYEDYMEDYCTEFRPGIRAPASMPR